MSALRIPLLVGVVALTTGCAATGFRMETAQLPMVPVQSLQPVGTAAGHYALGRIDLAAGRHEAAARRFEQALQLDPDLVDAYNALGIAHGLAGRYERAVTVFDAALLLAPGSAQLVGNLGYALLRAGRLDEANQWLARARELDPANPWVQENLKLLARVRQDGERQDDAPVAQTVALARQDEIMVERRSPYELVTTASNDGALMRVAPNVYEIRGGLSLAASATGALQASGATTEVVGAHRIGTHRIGTHRIGTPTARLEPSAAAATAASSMPATAAPPEPDPVATIPPAAGITRVSVRPSPTFHGPVSGLEISNGVGKPHLAGGTARNYARYGWRAVRISDYRHFGVAATEIHYLEGQREAAVALRATLPVPARLVLASSLYPGVNVQLVLGADMVGQSVSVAPAVISSADPAMQDG